MYSTVQDVSLCYANIVRFLSDGVDWLCVSNNIFEYNLDSRQWTMHHDIWNHNIPGTRALRLFWKDAYGRSRGRRQWPAEGPQRCVARCRTLRTCRRLLDGQVTKTYSQTRHTILVDEAALEVKCQCIILLSWLKKLPVYIYCHYPMWVFLLQLCYTS